MRPGGCFSRAVWFVSPPVAAFLMWFGWTKVGAGSSSGGKAFLIVWTVGIIAIEARNFRTMYLARDRRASTIQRAMDERDSP